MIIEFLDDEHNNDARSNNNKVAILKESCQVIFGNVSMSSQQNQKQRLF